MIFGKPIQGCQFFLGNDELKIVSDYTHVGVTLFSKGRFSVGSIKSKIQSCKKVFFSLVGCSLSQTKLSPISLSKLYWASCIPKLLSAGEVRCFGKQELEEFEVFHKAMARNIQQLPEKCPDPCVLASLGWREITAQVDVMKLMFIQRILSLDVESLYRKLFVRRFFLMLGSGVYSKLSPIARIIEAVARYDKINEVVSILVSGNIPSKQLWKKQVEAWVDDKAFSSWRFVISLYPRLGLYRCVISVPEPTCWWQLSKTLPFLKQACVSMMRLLCGTNVLAIAK